MALDPDNPMAARVDENGGTDAVELVAALPRPPRTNPTMRPRPVTSPSPRSR